MAGRLVVAAVVALGLGLGEGSDGAARLDP